MYVSVYTLNSSSLCVEHWQGLSTKLYLDRPLDTGSGDYGQLAECGLSVSQIQVARSDIHLSLYLTDVSVFRAVCYCSRCVEIS